MMQYMRVFSAGFRGNTKAEHMTIMPTFVTKSEHYSNLSLTKGDATVHWSRTMGPARPLGRHATEAVTAHPVTAHSVTAHPVTAHPVTAHSVATLAEAGSTS